MNTGCTVEVSGRINNSEDTWMAPVIAFMVSGFFVSLRGLEVSSHQLDRLLLILGHIGVRGSYIDSTVDLILPTNVGTDVRSHAKSLNFTGAMDSMVSKLIARM